MTSGGDLLDSAMPEPFSPDNFPSGDSLAFYYNKYDYTLQNFPTEIQELAGIEAFQKWARDFDLGLRENADCNILTYISECAIPKEQFLNAVASHNEKLDAGYIDEWTLTSEDVDVIFSGDIELINSTYRPEYALEHGNELFMPE